MKRLETLHEASERLQAAGFAASFRARDGFLVSDHPGRRLRPEELEVVEVVRFEGASDPADESILFALRSRDGGVRGLYSAVFGPGVAPEDAEVLHALGAGGRAGACHLPPGN